LLGTTPAIFQNTYPIIVKLTDRTIALPEVQLLPATALSSKNNSGFKTSDPKKMELLIL
jgi:CRISPR-associated protein Csx10